MAPPAQALLTSLVANVVFGSQGGSEDASGEVAKDEETVLETGGVEIIFNGEGGSHAHAVYPHYDDDPRHVASDGIEIIIASDGSNGHLPHVVYPFYGDKPEAGLLGAHAVYPKFEASMAGLIGGEANKDAIIEHNGIEIITSNRSNGRPALYPNYDLESGFDLGGGLISNGVEGRSPAVYPHFSDRPGMLGNHVVYPSFGDDLCGPIHGTVLDDRVIERHGVEVITSNDTKENFAHTIYPHFGDRPEGLLGSHVVYPSFGDDLGGLIHGTAIDDSVIDCHGVDVITSNDTKEHFCHTVYPHFGDRPEEGLLGSHVVYPSFGDVPEEGLIGSHAVYTSPGDNADPLVGEDLEDDSKENAMVGTSVSCSHHSEVSDWKSENVPAAMAKNKASMLKGKGTGGSTDFTNSLLKSPRSPPDPPEPSSWTGLHDHKQAALLVAAFFALPRADVLRAMSEAIAHDAVKSASPTVTCTGCGRTGGFANTPSWGCPPQLVTATT